MQFSYVPVLCNQSQNIMNLFIQVKNKNQNVKDYMFLTY